MLRFQTYKVDITASIAGCDELFSTETIFVLVDSNIPPPLCSFDKGPDVAPILDITRAIDQCAGKIFSTIDDAKACVLKNGEAEDAAGSCRPIATAVEATGVVGCLSDIRVTATIPGPCSTEASLTTISDPIQVIIDNERPIVTCSFVDGIAKTGSGVQVDSEFTYDVSENCPFDVSVKVAMYSNEFEDFNSQSMVLQYEKQEDSFGNAKVGFFAASTICTTKSNGQCITDPMEAGRRFYRATVTATDQAGLTGSETCWVEVSGGSTGDAAPGKSQQAFLLSTYFDSAYSATYDPKIFV